MTTPHEDQILNKIKRHILAATTLKKEYVEYIEKLFSDNKITAFELDRLREKMSQAFNIKR
jgi:hypothetical protein